MPPSVQPAAPTYRLATELKGRTWIFELEEGTYTLGSSRVCDVRLTGPGVSRQHATLRVHEQGLLVEDLRSKNGTFIEGRRVQRGVIPSGARLGIGRVELVVGRVAAGKPRRVDVWVIAATNVDLSGDGLRPDLYYRLAGGLLAVPPLRRVSEDVPALVRQLLGRSASEAGIALRGMTTGALERLRTHPWPGNVRQLTLVLRQLVSESRDGSIVDEEAVDHVLPTSTEEPPEGGAANHDVSQAADLELKPKVEALERALIVEAMLRSGGRKIRAAELLGVSRSGLDKMLRRLNVGTPWLRCGTGDDLPS